MADLAHRHLAVGAGTVWFCFYYYRRSVVRAIYHRRWQILGKVLGLKNVFCHCSAPNLVRLSGLSVHGALSRIHAIISYLLWLKKQTTKSILCNFKYDQPSWVPEYGLGSFVISSCRLLLVFQKNACLFFK